MRKSRLYSLAFALVLSTIAVGLTGAVIALGILLSHVLRPEVAGITTVVLGFALAGLLVASVFAYVLRSSHRSWKVNLSRYPSLKAAIERYREEGEGVRRLLPAFIVDGRRYFLVKYGRKNREWAPDKPPTGMLVLDEQGRVQDDEALFRSLMRSTRYVEQSYLHDSLVAQENMIAVGPRMEREAAEARRFFSRVVGSGGQAELMEDIDAFLTKMTEYMQRLAAVFQSEYRWCLKNRNRVEFTLEEMKPLWKVREAVHNWETEAAREIGQAWAKVEGQRSRLESLPCILRQDRARLRSLLDALGVSAKAISDKDPGIEQMLAERIEAYRSRTAKALQLETQAEPFASTV